MSTEIGQVGTQFDGLGHIGVQIGPDEDQMRFYNGNVESDFATATATKLESRSCIRSWRAASCSTSPARAASNP